MQFTGTNETMFPSLAQWLTDIKRGAYARENITEPSISNRYERNRTPPKWPTLLTGSGTKDWPAPQDGYYEARPLAGVWASPPYLHNGAVRTLWQLLLPPREREKSFEVGTYEYDTREMGFKDVHVDFGPTYKPTRIDTSLPGNSAQGHEAGTELSVPDKWALLEFIKTVK